ncbi:YegP family protein [Patescibacteria group bacterium]|nr:YegP family protein [Patescibacteria group bacterium]
MAKYQLKTDVAGNYYWILKSKNGETVAKSSESYDSKQGANTSIEWTRINAKDAVYEDLT